MMPWKSGNLSGNSHQLSLDLGDPFEIDEDLVGRESKGAWILAQPHFNWILGEWTALCNVHGMLAICSFKIARPQRD